MTKISKGESVTLKTIGAICEVLDCQPGDILSYEKRLSISHFKKVFNSENQF